MTQDPGLALAKALADENRYELLRYIAARPEVSCQELLAAIPLAQPTVSHHVKILVDTGLVTVRREGTRAFFTFDRKRFAAGLGTLRALSQASRPRRGPARRRGR